MNFIFSIIAWFLWNWAELVMEQRSLDDDGNPQTNFSFGDFVNKKKYLWIGNLACCPFLLIIGAKGLSLDPLAPILGSDLGWSDLYYAGAGPAFEAIIFIITKIKKFFAKV